MATLFMATLWAGELIAGVRWMNAYKISVGPLLSSPRKRKVGVLYLGSSFIWDRTLTGKFSR